MLVSHEMSHDLSLWTSQWTLRSALMHVASSKRPESHTDTSSITSHKSCFTEQTFCIALLHKSKDATQCSDAARDASSVPAAPVLESGN